MAQTNLEVLAGIYSDMFKDVYGVRAYGDSRWTEQDYREEMASLTERGIENGQFVHFSVFTKLDGEQVSKNFATRDEANKDAIRLAHIISGTTFEVRRCG